MVLTDPWFTFTATYDPGEAVACTVDELPDLAAVVVTHEHYDHCDLDALAGYRDLTVPLICPGTVVASTASNNLGFNVTQPGLGSQCNEGGTCCLVIGHTSTINSF